jgi:two-component system, OmpR family, sensor histidine kinase VicK
VLADLNIRWNGALSNINSQNILQMLHTSCDKNKRISRSIEPLIYSLETIQSVLFDALWSKALPAEQRIREIEEGLKKFTETISDASEIQKLAFDIVKSAKEEIAILFSTANAFKRQERVGLMRLLHETDPTVKVRILIPTSFALEDIIKGKFDENRGIEIRYFLNSSVQTILTSLTVDRKLCLVVELKDDTKDNSHTAVELATYSNSDSIV